MGKKFGCIADRSGARKRRLPPNLSQSQQAIWRGWSSGGGLYSSGAVAVNIRFFGAITPGTVGRQRHHPACLGCGSGWLCGGRAAISGLIPVLWRRSLGHWPRSAAGIIICNPVRPSSTGPTPCTPRTTTSMATAGRKACLLIWVRMRIPDRVIRIGSYCEKNPVAVRRQPRDFCVNGRVRLR